VGQARVKDASETRNDRLVRQLGPARASFGRKDRGDVFAISTQITGELVGRANVGPRGQNFRVSRLDRDAHAPSEPTRAISESGINVLPATRISRSFRARANA
jgi:hypothetical protein